MSQSDPGKHRKEQWGPREIIAIIIIVGAFTLAALVEITNHPGATIPAWVAALIAGVGLYYYKNGKEG